ncbi:hypothetical protein PR048_009806, partial [Dryococelus australis]
MHFRDFVNIKAATDDYLLKSPKPPFKIKSAQCETHIMDHGRQLMPFVKPENRKFYVDPISGVTKEDRRSYRMQLWKFRVMITVVAVMIRKKT